MRGSRVPDWHRMVLPQGQPAGKGLQERACQPISHRLHPAGALWQAKPRNTSQAMPFVLVGLPKISHKDLGLSICKKDLKKKNKIKNKNKKITAALAKESKSGVFVSACPPGHGCHAF